MLAALFGAFDYTEPNCVHSFQAYRTGICSFADAEEFAASSADRAFRDKYAVMHVMIMPQVQIGEYRADFLVLATVDITPIYQTRRETAVLKVVIECDGHDHHDLTKEQARHDRQRDRWMQSKGLSILRFTGSEIFRDVHRCAEEIVEFVDSWRETLGQSEDS
jgi:very-short-patch-repair endonuclease